MKNRFENRITMFSAGVLLAAVALSTIGCARTTNAANAPQPPDVEITTVEQKDIPIAREWIGSLDGMVNAVIKAQVPGYLLTQKYAEGSLVRKGQLLFEIDPRPFQAAVDQATGQLAQTNAQLAQAKAAFMQKISKSTLETRRDSLRLVEQRQGGGVATLLDLRQAEQLVSTAAETIPTIEQQIEQTENQISLLLGKNPDGVVRGRKFMEQEMPPEVPAGLPSSLLERRPDLRAAEQSLIAANANIGVAKAAYFPQLSLSGLLGGQSTQLASLFSGPHTAWSLVPQVTQPIFTGGRLKSNVRLAEAERDSALIQYQKAIQTAFTDVSNALIAHQRTHESRREQEKLVAALQDRKRLAYVRYRGGVDTQLNALDSDRDLFQAELSLAQIRLNELLSVVQLYKALGGGWQ